MNRPDFTEFNAGVQRARADYEAMPSRACAVDGCHNLRGTHRSYCRGHVPGWRRGAA